ncbi:MAG: hypothetical protein L0229_12455 [Blastocatellia bacterium]|nr:hypothetical protein [Blastocatellia bacterium]
MQAGILDGEHDLVFTATGRPIQKELLLLSFERVMPVGIAASFERLQPTVKMPHEV